MPSKLGKTVPGTFLRKSATLLAWVSGICIGLMAMVNFVVVVLRRSPLSGAWLSGGVEVSQELMAIVTASGLGYCWYLGGHVRIDAVRDRLKSRGRNILDAVNALSIALWIAVAIYAVFRTSQSNPTVLVFSGIAIGPVQVVFCVIMLHFLLVLLWDVRGFVAGAIGRQAAHGISKHQANSLASGLEGK